jgi:hypothetical protein
MGCLPNTKIKLILIFFGKRTVQYSKNGFCNVFFLINGRQKWPAKPNKMEIISHFLLSLCVWEIAVFVL